MRFGAALLATQIVGVLLLSFADGTMSWVGFALVLLPAFIAVVREA